MVRDNELYHYLRVYPWGYFQGSFNVDIHGQLIAQCSGEEGRAAYFTQEGANAAYDILRSLGYMVSIYGDP